MCLPTCIGFALGDLVYFWASGLLDHPEPFSELPGLSYWWSRSLMTAPMAASMLFRRMPRRPAAEMSAAMPILAVVLLALGWLAIVPKGDVALLDHALMMPLMLIPVLLRTELYTGAHNARG